MIKYETIGEKEFVAWDRADNPLQQVTEANVNYLIGEMRETLQKLLRYRNSHPESKPKKVWLG